MSETVDHRTLLSEIDAEVARRRRSGDLPADFEQQLDAMFTQLVPVDALSHDWEALLTRAERLVMVETLAPLKGSKSAQLVKKFVRKATAWQLGHLADQLGQFAHAMTRAARLLGDRVESLERGVTGTTRDGLLLPQDTGHLLDVEHWAPVVVEAVQGAPGRVLHADAGQGELVGRLVGEGVDAYGVEPRRPLAGAADEHGLEVRHSGLLEHLRLLPPGALGGVVLSGCVDLMLPGALVEVVDLSWDRVMPGGIVVVVGTDPADWALGRSPLEADLSLGRPLRARTWASLLAARGFESVLVHAGPETPPAGAAERPPAGGVEARPGDSPPPASYGVSATRPSEGGTSPA